MRRGSARVWQALVCVRHVGFNSEDARKSWNFPKGEMTGSVPDIYGRARDESQRMELVVARTSRIRRAQLIFIDHHREKIKSNILTIKIKMRTA